MSDDEQPIGITILGSGSKGNATIIHRGSDAIMIDAGFCRKEFQKRLAASGLPEDLRIHAILVTHEHSDHVSGLRLIAPYLKAQIFATSKCADYIRCHNKVEGAFNLIAAGGNFTVAGFSITPFSIPHDAVDPIAFTIGCGSRKIGVATDLGLANTLVSYELKNCDGLVLESNHDLNMLAASQRPWPLKQRIMSNMGHLSNDAASTLIEKIAGRQLQHLALAHLSGECNTPDIAQSTMSNCLGRLHQHDTQLTIAKQDEPIRTLWIQQ